MDIGVNSLIIITLNKIDLVLKDELKRKIEDISSKFITENRKIVTVSVKNNENIEALFKLINESLPQLIRFTIKIPVNDESQSIISWIYEKANVLSITYDEYATLSIECNIGLRNKIISKCNNINGIIVT